MTIIPLFRALTALLIPVGQIGVGVAICGAIALMIALIVDAAGFAGGAAALWLIGAMLSMGLWYSGDLLSPVAAAVVLPAAIGAGSACRWVVRRRPEARRSRAARRSARPAQVFESNKVARPARTADTMPLELTSTGAILAGAERRRRPAVAH